MRRAGVKAVVGLAVCLEVLGWGSLGGTEEVLAYGLPHAVAALGVAWGGARLVGPRLRGGAWRVAGFLLAVSGCLPFLGVPAVAAFLLLPLGAAPRPGRAGFRLIDAPSPLEGGTLEAGGGLGVEPLAELRRGGDEERRLTILLESRRLGDVAAVRLQAAALKDTSDEVRLLAHGLLEGRERGLYGRREAAARRLERVAPARRGGLYLERAWCGWELVFLGLARGECAVHVLQEAREHAREAMRLLPERGAPCLLLARILLRLGEVDAAARALGEARRRGLGAAVVAPHEAEVAFHRRRFGEVRAALAALGPAAGLRAGLEKLEEVWR